MACNVFFLIVNVECETCYTLWPEAMSKCWRTCPWVFLLFYLFLLADIFQYNINWTYIQIYSKPLKSELRKCDLNFAFQYFMKHELSFIDKMNEKTQLIIISLMCFFIDSFIIFIVLATSINTILWNRFLFLVISTRNHKDHTNFIK